MKFLAEVEKRMEEEDWKTLLLTYVKYLCYTAMEKPEEVESLFMDATKKGLFVEIYQALFRRTNDAKGIENELCLCWKKQKRYLNE